jgi:hypothetical protein
MTPTEPSLAAHYILTFEEFAESHRAFLNRKRFLPTDPPGSLWPGLLYLGALLLLTLIALTITAFATAHDATDPTTGAATRTTDSPVATALLSYIPWIFIMAGLWILIGRSPLHRRLAAPVIPVMLALGAVFVTTQAFISSPAPPTTTDDSGLLSLLPWLLYAAGLLYLFRLLSRHNVRVLWLSQPHLRSPAHVQATHTCLTVTFPQMATTYNWPAFLMYTETDNAFVLFVSAASFLPIPKRAFPTPADTDAFHTLLSHHIPQANPTRQGFEIHLQPAHLAPPHSAPKATSPLDTLI